MLPQIMQQFSGGDMFNLKSLAKTLAANSGGAAAADDDIPQLVENFDDASKNETTTSKPAETAST